MPTKQFAVSDLKVAIGGRPTLDGISFSLEPGKILAVIGGDGAGKTTLCRVLVGLRQPISGELRLPHPVGYQPAGSGTWGDLTVTENLRFAANAYLITAGEFANRLPPLLEATGLGEASDRLAGQLSGGMRQKLGVAMALLPRPNLLVLDEPTTGVDPVSRAELWQLISAAASEGAAVVTTTTYNDEARRSGEVLYLEDGRSIEADLFSSVPAIDARHPPGPPGDLLVEARDVVKSFGPVTAVDRMSLQVRSGEVVGLLGGNGAGKTTLIRCLLGLARPDSGTLSLLGQAPNREVLRHVGYVPQGLGLYADLSVAENLAFRRRIYGVEGMTAPEENGRNLVGDLSLGEQRRVAFAAALAASPRLLVLDEPTSGVDPRGRSALWATIKRAVREGAGALVTTHHLEEAVHCDRLVMMGGGSEVASGSLSDVIGDRTATLVEIGDQAAGYRALAAAGLPTVLTGEDLRVATGELRQVSQVLSGADLTAVLRSVPATLEETFVALSS
ncbi:MAG TPA: ATP-binding cassette domain-containing protein [Acidimicrobiia bacterium]|nr:ATP-binding cassette domain-containing protein [Acidimicrobiia bacterium]